MKITIGIMHTHINFEGDTLLQEKVQKHMHHKLGVKEEGVFHSRAYKSGVWDGITDFYDAKTDSFPTGLLPLFLEGLRELQDTYPNITYDIEDVRPAPLLHQDSMDEEIQLVKDGETITLRDYQYDSIKQILKEQVGIVNLATNAGKCVPYYTNLLTEDGYKTVEQIFKEHNVQLDANDREVPVQGLKLVNRYGELEEVGELTVNGKRKVKKVMTSGGLEQTLTHNHPLLVIDEKQEFVWKEAKDLVVGDKLVTRLGDNVFGNNNTVIEEDEAYVLGVIIADGCLSIEGVLDITNDKQEILDLSRKFFNSTFNKERKEYANKSKDGLSTRIAINSKGEVTSLLSKYGLSHSASKDKYIPQCIMQAPKHIQLSFLTGFIECECSIDTRRGDMEISSASKQLISQVQLLLKNLGVASTLRQKTVKGYEENYYGRLYINPYYSYKLFPMLNFITEQRKEQVTASLKRYENRETPTSKEQVPNGRELLYEYKDSYVNPPTGFKKKLYTPPNSGVSRVRMRELLDMYPDGNKEIKEKIEMLINENIFFDEVVSIEDAGEVNTYDVSMPKTNSFIAESIVNHNTMTAAGAIKQLLPLINRGERIAFMVHSKEILRQAKESITEALQLKPKEVGMVGEGKFDIKNKKLVFVMIPTLHSALKDPKKGVTFTQKDRLVKQMAEDIAPKFLNTVNTRTLIKNYLKNWKPKTKNDLEIETVLTQLAYDNAFTDKKVQMALRSYKGEFEKILMKKNKKNFEKWKTAHDFVKSIRVFIGDEAHRVKGESWYETALQCENAQYRIALTGTVNKKDVILYQRIRSLFSGVVSRVSNDEMVKRGVSSKPVIRMIEIKEPRGIELADNYLEAYKMGISNNEYRNTYAVKVGISFYKQKKAGVLISVNHIDHGEQLKSLIEAEGYECVFLKGELSSEERQEVLARFGSGEVPFMIGTTLIDEGLDLNSIGCLILAGAGKSLRQVLQRIGRGLRLNGIDGNQTLVVDFVDLTHAILKSHSKERMKIYKDEKFDIRVIGK